jgi:hypothetical protein
LALYRAEVLKASYNEADIVKYADQPTLMEDIQKVGTAYGV